MLKVLLVSRSGYSDWKLIKDRISRRQELRRQIDERVREAFFAAKQRYGAERIWHDLHEMGTTLNIKTIHVSLKRQGLVAKAARLFRVTTDSNHTLPVAPNLLQRDFSATAANEKWAGDITYLYTTEGWLYLAVIIDLFSRAIVGWSMSQKINAELVSDALKMALKKRGFPKGTIVHSDRGSQYASHAYRAILAKNQMLQSMSRKGDCWDNAPTESFFHSLKVELIEGEPLRGIEKMKSDVFEYIEVDYNRKRRHSANGFVSPMCFEAKMN